MIKAPHRATTGQQVEGSEMTSAEMARQVAIAQGIIDPVTGAVLGRFEVFDPWSTTPPVSP